MCGDGSMLVSPAYSVMTWSESATVDPHQPTSLGCLWRTISAVTHDLYKVS